jgi:putative SOS response-associated peptidase YedK
MKNMCGRYTLILLHDLKTIFPWITAPEVEPPPSYNICPTQPILAATNDVKPGGRPRFDFLRWGLIPSWAKEPSIGNRMINARAETLAEKPAFRTALRRRRCLIPADGFYEWRKNPDGSKTPIYARLKSHTPFAFAGLWEDWHDPTGGGSRIRSCTIITTPPNELMKPIHDRMPAIVPREKHEFWISPREMKPEELQDCLAPYPAVEMEAAPCSNDVFTPPRPKAKKAQAPTLWDGM